MLIATLACLVAPAAVEAGKLPTPRINDVRLHCATNVTLEGVKYRGACVRFVRADMCPGRDLVVVVRANGLIRVYPTTGSGRQDGTVIPAVDNGRRVRTREFPLNGGTSYFVYVGYTGTVRHRFAVNCASHP